MYFKFSIDDSETSTFWRTVADATAGIRVADVMLAVGLFYIVATYYRSYRGNGNGRSPVVAVTDDGDTSGARGDEPRRGRRLDAGRDWYGGGPVDVRTDRHETLTAEMVGMCKRQEAMDGTLAELRAGRTAAGHVFGHVADLGRRFDALNVDFGRLQRVNEKLVRKCDGLKHRLGQLERQVSTNSSAIIGSSYRAAGHFAFDGPAAPCTADHHRHVPTTYPDGYQRHPFDDDVIQTVPSARTNNVVGPPSPSSCPPPPPPPPASKDDPALRVYTPIPITTEILKTVTLVKAGNDIPKIKIPSGWISKKNKPPPEE